MKRVIIACNTLRDELMNVYKETGCDEEIFWVESHYHVDPKKLRSRLQEIIDNLINVDEALFVYGCCGSGLVDLKATTTKLIIPNTDDCISLITGRSEKMCKHRKEAYFLTKGWIEFDKGLVNEYYHALGRYGEKRAKRIFDAMLQNYRYLVLVNTDAYSVADYLDTAKGLAFNTNLELIVCEGDLLYLKKLLSGPHDEQFITIPKGEYVTISHFGYRLPHRCVQQ